MSIKEFEGYEKVYKQSGEIFNKAFDEFITSCAKRLRMKTYSDIPLLFGNYVYKAEHDEHLNNKLVISCCNVYDYEHNTNPKFFPIYNPNIENDDYGWDMKDAIGIYKALSKQILKLPSYCFTRVKLSNEKYLYIHSINGFI